MQKQCLFCGKNFTAQRSTAKFDSDACKMAFKRKPVTVSQSAPVNVTVDPPPKHEDKDTLIRYLYKPEQFKNVKYIDWKLGELDQLHKIPCGRVTEVYGNPSVGKSTLMHHLMKNHPDKKILLIDSEASTLPERLEELGIGDNVKISYESFVEDIYDIILESISNFDIIILDSVANCSFRTEEAGEAPDANIGVKSRILGKLMRLVVEPLRTHQTALILINQERVKIGGYPGEIYTPGGAGIAFAAAFRLKLHSAYSKKFPDKGPPYKGQKVEAEVRKSKLQVPGGKVEFKLYYNGDTK